MTPPTRSGFTAVAAGLGAVALTAAAALALAATPRWLDEAGAAERARQALSAVPAARQAAKASPIGPARTPQQAAASDASRVASLLKVASRHHLRILSVQQRRSGGAAARLQVSLPVEGRYVDLRRFVEAALRADAGLSLDSLRMERPNANAATLSADLEWTLHAVPDHPAPTPPLAADEAPRRVALHR